MPEGSERVPQDAGLTILGLLVAALGVWLTWEGLEHLGGSRRPLTFHLADHLPWVVLCAELVALGPLVAIRGFTGRRGLDRWAWLLGAAVGGVSALALPRPTASLLGLAGLALLRVSRRLVGPWWDHAVLVGWVLLPLELLFLPLLHAR
jgi:hypothetical protein